MSTPPVTLLKGLDGTRLEEGFIYEYCFRLGQVSAAQSRPAPRAPVRPSFASGTERVMYATPSK